jgi:membrane protease YdiL (CAAX protease family)
VAGAYGTAVAIGAGRLDVHLEDATPDWANNLLVSLVIGTVIIVGEEIGWRGYLLPRFQQLTSKRRAAVVTGFAHGCFHLPLILLATTYDTGSAKWFAAPMAVAVITAGGVFYAWIWDRSKTVWPVAIAHNVVNTVFDLGAAGVVATAGWNLAYVAGETGFATLGVCVVSAVVLLRTAKVWQQSPEPAVEPVLVSVAAA